MAVVQSLGQLVEISTNGTGPVLFDSWSAGSVNVYGSVQTYAQLYERQPNIRKCVDLLARNVGSLAVRLGEQDDVGSFTPRFDHAAAQTLRYPNPFTTRQRFFSGVMGDLATFDNSYAVKVRLDPIALVRIPPQYVIPFGGLWPIGYQITMPTGKQLKVPPSELIHYRGFYNPSSTLKGLSPIETLRRILAEEESAAGYRQGMWQQGARMAGLIQRPVDAGDWGTETRNQFRAEWEAMFSGDFGSGRTAILEEGMTWKPMQFNAVEAEYIASRTLNLEECVRAYHIPRSIAQIPGASKSNIDDEHTQFYQDTLGPWIDLIESETELQFLHSEFPSDQTLVISFDIDQKLRGSFATEAAAYATAVGAPVMTRDEARARRNLPPLPEGQGANIVTPLNVLEGGQPSPRTTLAPQDNPPAGVAPTLGAASLEPGQKDAGGVTYPRQVDLVYPRIRKRHAQKYAEVMSGYFNRQRKAIDSLLGSTKHLKHAAPADIQATLAADRWNRELGDDLYALNVATATAFAERVAKTGGITFDESKMYAWLRKNADIAAANINTTTATQVAEKLADGTLGPDDTAAAIRGVFDVAVSSRATQIGLTKVATAANFGAHEAAQQSGYRQKTWQTNSDKPRLTHDIDGETVGIDEPFSNGLAYPGDPSGGADEVAGCTCSLAYSA
jgi:HK97 family phage portal protein